MFTNDKTFTKLFSKAHSKGLQLGGRSSFVECELADIVARTIRTFGPTEGQAHLDTFDAMILLRVAELTYNPRINTAMLQPGGGFPLWIVDLGKLHKAIAN